MRGIEWQADGRTDGRNATPATSFFRGPSQREVRNQRVVAIENESVLHKECQARCLIVVLGVGVHREIEIGLL
jgi:hypothetical protein